MKKAKYLLPAILCVLCAVISAGCAEDSKQSTGLDALPSTESTVLTENIPSESNPNPGPVPPSNDNKDRFLYIPYSTADAGQGMYVLASSEHILPDNYQYLIDDIRSNQDDTNLVMKQYSMELHPDAIAGLNRLNLAFIKEFSADNRYLLLVQKSYVSTDRTSEHATGYGLDLHFWDTKTKLIYDLGNFAVTKETKFVLSQLDNCGFVQRYKDEPSHLRYIGAPLAKTLTAEGMTFDAFIEKAISHSFDNPLVLTSENGGFTVYCVAASDNATTTLPIPRNVENHMVSGLNNGYFIVLIPHTATDSDKGGNLS